METERKKAATYIIDEWRVLHTSNGQLPPCVVTTTLSQTLHNAASVNVIRTGWTALQHASDIHSGRWQRTDGCHGADAARSAYHFLVKYFKPRHDIVSGYGTTSSEAIVWRT